jgi:hypothetical protein
LSLGEVTKQFVRRRARFACEYCSISETSAGGELTVDHFRPQSKNGGGELENLVYACVRCNLYKGDFWVENTDTPPLWNPRTEPFENHFRQTDDGYLFAITETGELTLRTLKLNRPQLVEHRRQLYMQTEERRLLRETRNSVQVLLHLNEEQSEIIRQQELRLEEQQRLLKTILNQKK